MIPTQLKDQKFCRVLKGTKEPFELGWQNNPYTYDQIQKYFPKENYGVQTGWNNLAGFDDDSQKKGYKEPVLINLFLEKFGKTFRVRGHLYLKLNGWDCNKITFFDSDGFKIGELQGKGQQLVGPGSLHPSGELYEVKDDCPIIELDYSEFEKVFGQFMVKKEAAVVRDFKRSEWKGDDIRDIPITSIISLNGLKSAGNGCYQGPHPGHGSTNGMNFRVDTNKNVWKCFRDYPSHGGGGPAELIAVIEGIIDCSQAGRSCFTETQGRQVIQIAREKYGLKVPEPKTEPRGWANSVSIVRLAKRNSLTQCPKCRHDFVFVESHGWFSCFCQKGNIKDFAQLVADSKVKA